MIITRAIIVDGIEWGTAYHGRKGDVFPVHTHTDADNHITILTLGAIRLSGHPDYEGAVAEAKIGGTIMNWKAGNPHGWEVLADGTTWINFKKNRQ